MPKQSYHHGDLKNALIDAGIALINQQGIDHLSLRKAAALCNVSQAAPYTHFASKEDFLDAMRNHVLDLFMLELQNAVKACPDQNDPSLLIQMGKRYVLFFIENPQYFSFIFSQHCMTVNLDLDGDEPDDFPPHRLFKSHAKRILGSLGMPDEKIEDVIISMWATVHGLASLATMENVHYGKDWVSKVEDIISNK